jgi:uncharacterized protein YjbJ (UPF0337 family)
VSRPTAGPRIGPPARFSTAPSSARGTSIGIADKASNAFEDLTGKAKKAVGEATGKDNIEAEGQADQAKGAKTKRAGENVGDT